MTEGRNARGCEKAPLSSPETTRTSPAAGRLHTDRRRGTVYGAVYGVIVELHLEGGLDIANSAARSHEKVGGTYGDNLDVMRHEKLPDRCRFLGGRGKVSTQLGWLEPMTVTRGRRIV